MPLNTPPPSRDLDGVEAARRQRVERAGLRGAPRSGEPTGAFVAVEMAVLVFVSVLAMVSVIVTTSSPAEARVSAAGAQRIHVSDHVSSHSVRPSADR